MSLREFLHNLHFDIGKASVPNWEVDWEDAPLPYKLFRGLPVVPLSLEVPLTLERRIVPAKPDLQRVGHFLWYVFGLTQFSETVFSPEYGAELMQSYRRFVPSGGALYPNELYVYLKIEDIPVGVYHYDVAHHRLVLLREGNFDSYLTRALGHRCEVSSSFATVFVSTMFWKNFFKYNNFSYRLHGLDTGVLIGQVLEASKRFGFASGVYFQFLDRAINHLLGMSEKEESVYAVIPLSVEPTNWSTNGSEVISAAELCRELPLIQPSHYQRSRTVKEYPMLTKMNVASMQSSTYEFRIHKALETKKVDGPAIALPQVDHSPFDWAVVCRKRFSPEMDFVLGKVSQTDLAVLLQDTVAAFTYRNDLDGAYGHNEPRVSLYGCLYNVEGISNGAYHYDSTSHSLKEVNRGDHRLWLQFGMSLHNVNLLQVPLCFHVSGDRDFLTSSLGFRGYRIQQMEAGMLLQRLVLAASALGMGGHPLLGYDVNLCDDLYRMKPYGKTSLIQVPVGPYRPRPWLKAGLHS